MTHPGPKSPVKRQAPPDSAPAVNIFPPPENRSHHSLKSKESTVALESRCLPQHLHQYSSGQPVVGTCLWGEFLKIVSDLSGMRGTYNYRAWPPQLFLCVVFLRSTIFFQGSWNENATSFVSASHFALHIEQVPLLIPSSLKSR